MFNKCWLYVTNNLNTKTNIQIEKTTRLKLIEISHKNESYDDILNRLLELKEASLKA